MVRGCTNQQRLHEGRLERGVQNPSNGSKSEDLSASRSKVPPSAELSPGLPAWRTRPVPSSRIDAEGEEEDDEIGVSDQSPETNVSGDAAEVDELESSCEELEELTAPPKPKAKRHISATADTHPPKRRKTTLSQAARNAILGSTKAGNSEPQQVRKGLSWRTHNGGDGVGCSSDTDYRSQPTLSILQKLPLW